MDTQALTIDQAAPRWICFEKQLTADSAVTEYSALVPVADCRAVIAELVPVVKSRPSPAEAAGLAKRLMGSYSARDFNDPQVFSVVLTELFHEYPPAVGAHVAKTFPRMSSFPDIEKITTALNAEVERLRKIGARAKLHIAEAERRRAEAARRAKVEQETTPEMRAKISGEMRSLSANLKLQAAIRTPKRQSSLDESDIAALNRYKDELAAFKAQGAA